MNVKIKKSICIFSLLTALTVGCENKDIVSDYKTAYKNFIKENKLDAIASSTYDLIYVDEDDIPELVYTEGDTIMNVSLYSYKEGSVHTILDAGNIGFAGNIGYSYCHKKNSICHENYDYAGLLRYFDYMKINDKFEFEVTDSYTERLFEDKDNNGFPSGNEFENLLDEPIYFIGNTQVTKEETDALSKGEYKYIKGNITLDELYDKLQ